MKTNLFLSASAAVLAGLTLAGCSASLDEISNSPVQGERPNLSLTVRSGEVQESAYPHKAILVANDNISEVKSAAAAASLDGFTVEPGDYMVYAIAASDETNLTYTALETSSAVTSARIKVTDMSAQIPEIMIGKSATVTVGSADATANVELSRAVAYVNVTVSGLESVEAASMTMTIGNMYDQIDLNGAAMNSGDAFSSKTVALTKDASGKFIGNAIVMPTDASAGNLSLTYTINGTSYKTTPAGKLESNNRYELNTTVTGQTPASVSLKSVVSYAAWNSELVTLTDSFDTAEEAEKEWVGPTLIPIGGADTHDNFWASSDQGDSGWGETYWTYNLYDGNAADGSNYWCPADWDRTSPCWYIDLGAAMQGVEIHYWNKAGGKGGQKVYTMDIYGSNTESDYSSSTDSWVKLTTFTSDKTAPTTDAGAEVSTGKVAFSEDGSVSYRYVKCVFTSKVSADGAVVTDAGSIDVSVGEANVYGYEYK